MRVARFLGVQTRLIALLLIASTIVVVSESAEPAGASPCPASNVSINLTYTYSAPNCIARYDYLGTMQTFTVPTGITSLTFQVVAASGGRFLWNGSANSASPGGTGGSVSGTLTVTPGATLNLFVGGQGGSPTAGWNGGGTGGRCTLCDPATPIAGGGGGASDIRIGGTASANRRVTAGGGGGAGGYGGLSAAQANAGGGNGGSTAYNSGGVKGASGLSGSDGGSPFSEEGGGATPIAGGLRGQWDTNENQQSGTSGTGGNGRSNLYAGAGGGGFFGGGGANAGGGGGGSSHVDTTVVSGDSYATTNTGNGYIVLTYAAPFPTVTINTTTSSPSRNSSFSYAVTFSSPVDAATLIGDDFQNAGIATGCQFSTTPSSGSATSFTLTVSSCSDGTITPRLSAGSVTDGSGVTGPAANTTGNSITKDTSAPAAPGAPALAPASDTGSSNSDNVTTDDTPAFSVSGGSTGDTATITATNGATSRSCTYVIGTGTSCDISPALSEGTWSITGKLTDQAGNESAAGAATSLTVDRTAPSAPGAPDLAAAADSGSSDSDDLTNDTTPTLSLPGAGTGETVEFTATQGATSRSCSYVVGIASSCDISPALGTGAWSVTAKVTDAAGNQSAAGTALPLTIDTTAPSAPGTPDLAASSDLGTSPTDNLTSDTTPTVSATGGTSGDTMTITATQGSTTRSCNYVVGSATSCDISPALGDGVWALTARLTDTAGNQSTVGSGLNITVDATAPTLGTGPDLAASSDSGSSDTDNVTADTTPTMSLGGGSSGDRMTLTATNGATTVSCTYTIGSTSSCDLPTLTDGTWSVSGSITDPSGNTSSHGTPLSLRIDTTAPSAPGAADLAATSDTGSSPTDNVTSDSTPTFSVSGGSTGDTATITASNGSTTRQCTYTIGVGTSCDLSGLTDGTWNVSGTLTDPAGNVSPAGSSTSLSLDATAPSAPGQPDLAATSDTGNSATDDLTGDSTPTISVSGGSTGDTATITASNGSTTTSCSYTIGSTTSCDLSGLTDGAWSITGTLTDPAGNVSSTGAALNLTVDGTAPTLGSGPDVAASSDTGPSPSDNVTNDLTPTMSLGGGSNGDRVTLTATNGATTVSCSYTIGSTSSCDLPALTDGTWTVSGSITDPAGNTATHGTQLSLRVDATAPVPTRPDLLPGSDSGASSTDDVTQDSTPSISVPGLSTGDQVTVTAARGSTSVTCTYTVGVADSCDLPTLADGTWSISAAVVDSAGNAGSTSAQLSLAVDTTPPSAPSAAPDLASSSDSGASNSDDATNDITPTVSLPGGAVGDTATVTATSGAVTLSCTYSVGSASSCDLPALTDGTWNIAGTYTDPAGNTSPAGPSLPVTIDSSSPTVPATPDLAASSDSGASSTDNITSDSTPQFEMPGAEIGASVVVSATKGSETLTCTFVVSATTTGCSLPTLSDGTWSVSATATDTRGNVATTAQPLTLRIDTSNPFRDSVTSTETNTSTTTTVPKRTTTTTTPRGGGGSAAASTTVPRRPATTTTTTVPKSPPGVPDLRTDSDTGSNRADNVTNDRTPVVGIEGLSDGDAVTMTARRKGSTVSCSYVVGRADGCRLPELSDGSWTIGADVVDLAGNSASAPESLEFRVDGTAPDDALVISSTDDPVDGAMTVDVADATDGNTVTVTATNGTSTVECSFVASTTTNSCTLEGIEVGEWSVTAVSTDSAGNMGSASTPFTFSLVPPTTSVPTTTVPPRNSTPVPGGDGSGDGNGDGSGTTPLSGDDAVRLLASMLALLAIRRRSGDGPERLGEGDREASGVAEYAAGTGSGGLDVREDLYRPPCSDRFDLAIRDLAGRTARFSSALGRSIDDGSYLRALVGMFWAILPAAGAVLGVVAARDTDSTVVLPALWIVLSLLVVGTLDAGAGLAAAVAYGTVMLAGGGLDSADGLRGFMGIAALMFLVGLVASSMRPFRRADGDHPGWNRLVDAVLIPLIGAWTAGTMYAAVPHLSGFDVPWSDRTGAVELCALLVLTARWGLENLARLTVSKRLALIENETLPEPDEVLKTASRVVRTAVFAFVAVVFIGSNWWLVTGTAMFLVPKLIEPMTGRFPNNRRLHRALPRNLVRIVAMLLIMLWWGLWVGEVVDANEVQWAFVLMGIPGLAVGAADWFGREGDDWPSTATSRILGVLTLLLGVALVRGWLL